MVSAKNKYLYRIDLLSRKKKTACNDILHYILLQLGIRADEIIEEEELGKNKIYFYLRKKSEVESFLKKFARTGLKNVEVKAVSLTNEDWQDKWKEHYKPFKINKTITVVPTWIKDAKKWDERKTVFLDVGMVFGSGLHSTTRFMAELIELKKTAIKDFIDIGTGTGILAVIAFKLGAENLWCIDIDQEAVMNAKKNLKFNRCSAECVKRVALKEFKSKKQFDLVAANLQTHDLVEMRRRIVGLVKPGKYLAVSGISACNYKKFRNNFDGGDIRCLRIKKDKEWCAVLYKRV